MKGADCLRQAASLISGSRHEDYGDARENFSRIAAYWSVRLGIPVSAVDVADCLALMKMARKDKTPGHTDSAADACGYIALAIEIATCDGPADRQSRAPHVDPDDLPTPIGTGVD